MYMKKVAMLLSVVTMVAVACNNETKDSVEKADSTNKANIDSSTAGTPTVATDAETSSFLVKAADGGMTEVQLGKIAQEKGNDPRVKDFGSMMIHDHSAVNDQVKSLAAQRNVTLPDSVSDEHKKEIADLSKKTGKAFDKAYVDAMVKGHESTIDLFQSSLDKSNDTDVKAFINNTLPKVKSHLEAVKEIQKSMK
jgi:putative membrane protein